MTHTQELARYYKISCNANRYLKRFYTFVSDSGRVPALTNHDPIHIATMWDMRSPLQLQMTQQLTGGSSGKEWDPQKTVKRQSLRFGKVSLSATFEHRNTHTHILILSSNWRYVHQESDFRVFRYFSQDILRCVTEWSQNKPIMKHKNTFFASPLYPFERWPGGKCSPTIEVGKGWNGWNWGSSARARVLGK